jgi:hypothetical protein
MKPTTAISATSTFAQRLARQKHAGGSRAVALLVILLGLVVFTCYHWAIGLCIMFASALVDARHTTVSWCSGCGNEVSATSLLCPVCGAKLSNPAPLALPWLSRSIWGAVLTALGIAAWHWCSRHPEFWHWLPSL